MVTALIAALLVATVWFFHAIDANSQVATAIAFTLAVVGAGLVANIDLDKKSGS